jgi:hypothetical protein
VMLPLQHWRRVYNILGVALYTTGLVFFRPLKLCLSHTPNVVQV